MYLNNLISAVLGMFMYSFIYFINYYTANLYRVELGDQGFFSLMFVLLKPGKEHVFIYTGSKPNYCYFFYFLNFDMLLYFKRIESKSVNKLW